MPMSNHCLVSIIMPVYNAERFLPQTLASVESELAGPAELIAVDNASADKSLSILKQFAAKYPAKVKVLEQKEGMAGGARNAGLRAAEGEYVFFMDADDALFAQALPALYQYAKQQQADIAVGEFIKFTQQPFSAPPSNSQLPPLRVLDQQRVGIKEMFLVSQSYNVPWNKLIRRELLNRYQLAFPQGMPHEDLPFMSTVFVCAKRVVFCPVIAYQYRLTPNSLSRRNPEKKLYSLLQSFAVMRGKLQQLGLYQALQEEYEYYLLQMIIGNDGPGNGNLKLLSFSMLRKFLKQAAPFYLTLSPALFTNRSWLFKWKFFVFRQGLKWQSPLWIIMARYLTNLLGLWVSKPR